MNGKFFRNYIKLKNLPAVVRAKWDDDLLNEGVVPFPKKVMRNMNKVLQGENALEKMMLITAVADFKRPNYGSLPSVEYLAYTSGLSVERFMQILNELQDEGLVECQSVEDRVNINTKLFTDKIVEKEKEEAIKNEIPF